MTGDTPKAIVFMVRFKSKLSYDEILKRAQDRISQYRAIPGLLQKYYLHDPATGEFGGLYVWDSQKSLDEFKASDLRKTIAETYQVIGEPRIEVLNVGEILRETEPVSH